MNDALAIVPTTPAYPAASANVPARSCAAETDANGTSFAGVLQQANTTQTLVSAVPVARAALTAGLPSSTLAAGALQAAGAVPLPQSAAAQSLLVAPALPPDSNDQAAPSLSPQLQPALNASSATEAAEPAVLDETAETISATATPARQVASSAPTPASFASVPQTSDPIQPSNSILATSPRTAASTLQAATSTGDPQNEATDLAGAAATPGVATRVAVQAVGAPATHRNGTNSRQIAGQQAAPQQPSTATSASGRPVADDAASSVAVPTTDRTKGTKVPLEADAPAVLITTPQPAPSATAVALSTVTVRTAAAKPYTSAAKDSGSPSARSTGKGASGGTAAGPQLPSGLAAPLPVAVSGNAAPTAILATATFTAAAGATSSVSNASAPVQKANAAPADADTVLAVSAAPVPNDPPRGIESAPPRRGQAVAPASADTAGSDTTTAVTGLPQDRAALPAGHIAEVPATGAAVAAPVSHGVSVALGTGVSHTAVASAVNGSASVDASADVQPGATTSHSGALEVGYHDTTLGWLSVRASVDGAGDLHAAIAGHSSAATSAVNGMMPALNRFLQEQNVAVQSVSSSAQMAAGVSRDATAQASGAGNTSFSQAQGQAQSGPQSGGQQSAQSGADSQRRNDTASHDTSWVLRESRRTGADIAANGAVSFASPGQASTVSVRI